MGQLEMLNLKVATQKDCKTGENKNLKSPHDDFRFTMADTAAEIVYENERVIFRKHWGVNVMVAAYVVEGIFLVVWVFHA